MIRELVYLAGYRLQPVGIPFRWRIRSLARGIIVRAAPTCTLWREDDWWRGRYRYFALRPRWIITEEEAADYGARW